MIRLSLSGPVGQRFDANVAQWLRTAPYVNPGMLAQYFQRDRVRPFDLVPWYGEFSGKYLTSAALCYGMKPDEALREAGDYVVRQLGLAQSPEGYLGVWPVDQRLNGRNRAGDKTWDAWSHYHNLLGLYLWHEATGSEDAWAVCLKAAEYIHWFYVVQGHPVDEDKDGTDAALSHVFALLYRKTGDARWLEVVRSCLAAFEGERGGDYFRAGLEGKNFFEMKRTRWECLHAIEAIGEMYRITGERGYLTAFKNIWRGIRAFDRHNTGGFSSGESATGDPYDTHAIETCCTIAWMALSLDMLRLSGEVQVADELELTTLNGMLGAQNATGRSFTYNTPMLGVKKASSHEIVFQAVAGSYELNCCSVNGPRGFGMIGEWGATAEDGIITLHYYGSSSTELSLDGVRIALTQEGDYPFGGRIRITVECAEGVHFTLRLRIPFWSRETKVSLCGTRLATVHPGYLTLPSVKNGDAIEIGFDMRPHFWQGDRALAGRTSVYVGPILLAYDERFNDVSYVDALRLDLSTLRLEAADCTDELFPAPLLLLRARDGRGGEVLLCDFTSAGQTGTGYSTWLPTDSPLNPPALAEDAPAWGQMID